MNTYLVQRLQFKKPVSISTETLFSELYQLDYMGSAEYEFGAFAKFLVSMAAGKMDTLPVFTIGSTIISVIYDTTKISQADAVNRIQDVYDQKTRLKEQSYYTADRFEPKPDPRPISYQQKISAWADIDNNFFWTIDSILPKQVIAAINKSSDLILKNRADAQGK